MNRAKIFPFRIKIGSDQFGSKPKLQIWIQIDANVDRGRTDTNITALVSRVLISMTIFKMEYILYWNKYHFEERVNKYSEKI